MMTLSLKTVILYLSFPLYQLQEQYLSFPFLVPLDILSEELDIQLFGQNVQEY